jgi:hypothetical protein
LVQSFEDPTKPFTERRGAYLGAAALLKRVAEPHDPRPASGIPADALDEEAIVEEIARELRENKEIDLFKLETDFAESAEMLIATLRDLMNATDETKILLKEYQDKTREEVTGTIRSFERAQLVRERWIRAYNIFVDRVEKSKKLTVTTSQEWEKALSILVAGLKTAIGKEADWTKELAAAQGSRPRGTSMNAGGGAPGSYQSPYGNTFHGWMTARRIQIIRNRAAIYRARTARIAGN